MPGRFHLSRRAAQAGPAAERAPDVSAVAAPPRRAPRWLAGPDGPADEWRHRHRRQQLTRADEPSTLRRPAVQAGPADAASAWPPVPASAPASRRPMMWDFSRVRAHRAARPSR